MKKIILAIVIEILLLYNLVFALYGCSKYIEAISLLADYPAELNSYLSHYITWIVLYFISAIISLTVMVLTAIKDFPVFKPLIDKYNTYKAKRAQAKTEREKANRQARIEELENELAELKKDE